MVWRQMLDKNKSYAFFGDRRHGGKKRFKGAKTARRSPNAHDGKVGARWPFRRNGCNFNSRLRVGSRYAFVSLGSVAGLFGTRRSFFHLLFQEFFAASQ